MSLIEPSRYGSRAQRRAAVHPSHKLGRERSEIRSPVGTPRFYGVRACKCGAEIAEHPAGLFIDDELFEPCSHLTAKERHGT